MIRRRFLRLVRPALSCCNDGSGSSLVDSCNRPTEQPASQQLPHSGIHPAGAVRYCGCRALNARTLLLTLAVAGLAGSGCDWSSATRQPASGQSTQTTQESIAAGQTPGSAAAQVGDQQLPDLVTGSAPGDDTPLPAATPGYRQKLADWVSAAAGQGINSADAARQWVGASWNGLAETGSLTAKGTADWAASTWQSLRDAGLTQANSAREWLQDEVRRPQNWEYRVLDLAAEEPADAVAEQLNTLGKDRWECVSAISLPADRVRLIFKRHPYSVLTRIPLSDALRLLDSMGGGNQ